MRNLRDIIGLHSEPSRPWATSFICNFLNIEEVVLMIDIIYLIAAITTIVSSLLQVIDFVRERRNQRRE